MKNVLPIHSHLSTVTNPLRFLYIILLLASAVCTITRTKTSSGVIQGKIYIIGHDPFPQLGLEDATGTVYVLSCPEEIRKELEKQQGQRVRLHCSSILKNKHQNKATVKHFEVIENEL